MRNSLTKITLALVCLALVSLPLFAQKGKGGGSTSSSGCAIVTTPSLSTTTAAPGINVGVYGRVTNCSGGRARYTVTISAVSTCGEETIIASSLITFNGGESKLISISYPIAPDTCRGVSTVSISAYSGSTLLSSQSAALTIQ